MSRLNTEIAVIGSGFAGSLTAAILQKCGRACILIDRARHPRFAIGESSTPTAGLILKSLAETYSLDWLAPLAKYGTWKRAYPDLTCGRKRGFSYFEHRPGESFKLTPGHERELLVAASVSDEVSDTQWLRAETDAFIFEQALNEGAIGFEGAQIQSLRNLDPGWRIELLTESGRQEIDCQFLIDSSGAGNVIGQHLGIDDLGATLQSRSRAIFGHFTNLPRWSASLHDQAEASSKFAASSLSEFPFSPDDAALHHILDEGWSWWLRFDSDVTSVGLVLLDAPLEVPITTHGTAEREWSSIFGRYPDLADALGDATIVAPRSGLCRTGRLQRLARKIVGTDWAMLPHTAGFIDPLHSTGIAHSLVGVERLCDMLLADLSTSEFRTGLQSYAGTVAQELRLIDQLVSGCQAAIRKRCFLRFVAFSKCYFAAATTWERRQLAGARQQALFLADDDHFCRSVARLHDAVAATVESPPSFEAMSEELLAPFDHVGLFSPPKPNMFGATALLES
jgi:tetracycline 7-halogenase / FADH2 O2-dependent halogenase